MRPARAALEAALFGGLLRLSAVLPRPALLRLGAAAGSLAYVLDRRHRRVALENLALAFGDAMDEAERRRVIGACFRHFGRILVDTLTFSGITAEDVGRLVEYRGLEHVRAAYARGRGVLVFSGHFGHWELVALMQGHLGLPLALVTRPLDNPGLERLLADLRGSSGNLVVHKRSAVREMARALRRGIGVAIVIDQDARGDGIFVPFFGRPVSTTPSLALLALRTGAAVVPVASYPRPDGSYLVEYGPEVPAVDTGDRDADVARITAACTAIIESWVRRRPELWLWMHRRFKTRPPGTAGA